jgi:hypothetical protein
LLVAVEEEEVIQLLLMLVGVVVLEDIEPLRILL